MRNVNLLYVLAGLMFAPLILNWRWAIASLAGLSVERSYPELVTSDQPVVVQIKVKNTRWQLASWSIWLTDRISKPNSKSTKVSALIPRIPVQNSGETSYKCFLPSRGSYELGAMTVSTRFPLGLVYAWATHRESEHILVAPRLGDMHARWQRIAYGDKRLGIHSAGRHKHNEGEFYAVRKWQSGDSQRTIHWRSSAKIGDLAVKQFEKKGDGSILLLLDFWAPERPEFKPSLLQKILGKQEEVDPIHDLVEYAASLFASVTRDSIDRQIRLIAGVASGSHKVYHKSNQRNFFPSILKHLASAVPDERPKIDECIMEARELADRDARIIVISTRSLQAASVQEIMSDENKNQASLKNLVWVDVTQQSNQDLVRF